MIKRYTPENTYENPWEDEDGEYVLYADHKAELEALRDNGGRRG